TSAAEHVPDYAAALTGNAKMLTVGVPRSLVEEGVDQEVSAAFRIALEVLRDRGAKLVDVVLPYASAAVPVYYLVATAEASSNLARYGGVRSGYRAAGSSRAATTAERTD